MNTNAHNREQVIKFYPYISAIGYKSPKLHPCNHEGYMPIHIDDRMHPLWIEFFQRNNFAINEVLRYSYVSAYERGFDVKPAPEDAMNVFRMSPEDVRVVLVGQDPYPGVYFEDKSSDGTQKKIVRLVANGYAFSTNTPKITSSQERMFASIPGLQHDADDYTLKGWISQGVFLMNKTPVLWTERRLQGEQARATHASDLSIPENKWHGISRNILVFLAGIGSTRGKTVYFLLMGEKAKSLKENLANCIEASHPSGKSSFTFNGECFRQLPCIDWRKAS